MSVVYKITGQPSYMNVHDVYCYLTSNILLMCIVYIDRNGILIVSTSVKQLSYVSVL